MQIKLIPAGVFSDNPLPDRVEAYYGKNYSKILALEATEAIDNFSMVEVLII